MKLPSIKKKKPNTYLLPFGVVSWMLSRQLNTCKDPAPNWKRCKFQCKEFTVEDWGSGWKVMFKTSISSRCETEVFSFGLLSELLVLLQLKRGQSRDKKGGMLRIQCFVHLSTHSLIAFSREVLSLSFVHLEMLQAARSGVCPARTWWSTFLSQRRS